MRTKSGEIAALAKQSPTSFNRLYPVFCLTSELPGSFVPNASKVFKGATIGLDGLFNFQTTGSGVAYVQTFGGLVQGSVDVIPCIPIDGNPNYVAVAVNLAQQRGYRAFIKVKVQHIHALPQWMQRYGLQQAQCDLIIDVGQIADIDVGLYEGYIVNALSTLNGQQWKSITLSSSAAPKDYTGLALGINHIQRTDWQLWNQVHNKVPYKLDYSDYTTVHPDLTEPPGAAMARASVSIRYSVDQHWIIIKGVSTSGANGQPMPAQFLSHAQLLVKQPGFDQIPSCVADTEIVQITLGSLKGGSRAIWVRLAIDRHLSLVTDQLP